MSRGVDALCAEAERLVETWTVEEARACLGEESVVFVDLRDIRELWREGTIPGAVHAPRGMLEFWVDPQSPYAREIFQTDRRFLFYCAAGLRSVLAARSVQEMGLSPVCHMAGGYGAWQDAGHPTERKERPIRSNE